VRFWAYTNSGWNDVCQSQSQASHFQTWSTTPPELCADESGPGAA
jgi:hypothetical protein